MLLQTRGNHGNPYGTSLLSILTSELRTALSISHLVIVELHSYLLAALSIVKTIIPGTLGTISNKRSPLSSTHINLLIRFSQHIKLNKKWYIYISTNPNTNNKFLFRKEGGVIAYAIQYIQLHIPIAPPHFHTMSWFFSCHFMLFLNDTFSTFKKTLSSLERAL